MTYEAMIRLGMNCLIKSPILDTYANPGPCGPFENPSVAAQIKNQHAGLDWSLNGTIVALRVRVNGLIPRYKPYKVEKINRDTKY